MLMTFRALKAAFLNLGFFINGKTDIKSSDAFYIDQIKKQLALLLRLSKHDFSIDLFLLNQFFVFEEDMFEDDELMLKQSALNRITFACRNHVQHSSKLIPILNLSNELLESINIVYEDKTQEGLMLCIDQDTVLFVRMYENRKINKKVLKEKYIHVLRDVPSGFWISISHKLLFFQHKKQQENVKQLHKKVVCGFSCRYVNELTLFLNEAIETLFDLKEPFRIKQIRHGIKTSFSEEISFDPLYAKYHKESKVQFLCFEPINSIKTYGFFKTWQSQCQKKKGYVFLPIQDLKQIKHISFFVKMMMTYLVSLYELELNRKQIQEMLKRMDRLDNPIFVFNKNVLKNNGDPSQAVMIKNSEACLFENQGFDVYQEILQSFSDQGFKQSSQVIESKCTLNGIGIYIFYQFIRLSQDVFLLCLVKVCEINEAAKLIQNLKENNTISVLAAGVAHEIKNPLVPMKSLTKLLEDRWEDENLRKKYVEIILPQIDRINDLCDSLRQLKIFKPGVKKEENLLAILDEAILLIEPKEMQEKVVVNNHCDALPIANVDFSQFMQVFQNVLQNAVEASPNKTPVFVTFLNKKNVLVISIKDQGVGLTEYELKNMFNVFFTTKSSGNGLGMMMVKKILDDHQATINVHSQKEKGCHIMISLKPEFNQVTSRRLKNKYLSHD